MCFQKLPIGLFLVLLASPAPALFLRRWASGSWKGSWPTYPYYLCPLAFHPSRSTSWLSAVLYHAAAAQVLAIPPVAAAFDLIAALGRSEADAVDTVNQTRACELWALQQHADYSFLPFVGAEDLIAHPFVVSRQLLPAVLWYLGCLLATIVHGLSWISLPPHTTASRQHLAGLVGVLLMLTSFLPASHLFFRVGFYVAERTLYVPCLGSCLLLAACLSHVSRLLSLATAARCKLPLSLAASMALLACIAGLILQSRRHARRWATDKAWWEAELAGEVAARARLEPLTTLPKAIPRLARARHIIVSGQASVEDTLDELLLDLLPHWTDRADLGNSVLSLFGRLEQEGALSMPWTTGVKRLERCIELADRTLSVVRVAWDARWRDLAQGFIRVDPLLVDRTASGLSRDVWWQTAWHPLESHILHQRGRCRAQLADLLLQTAAVAYASKVRQLRSEALADLEDSMHRFRLDWVPYGHQSIGARYLIALVSLARIRFQRGGSRSARHAAEALQLCVARGSGSSDPDVHFLSEACAALEQAALHGRWRPSWRVGMPEIV